MRIISHFDGASFGLQAIKDSGVSVESYEATEKDTHAISVSQYNHPNIKHLGPIEAFKPDGSYDLMIGGSPCQGFSFAGKGRAFEDERSKLFFEFVRALDACKPKFFMLENVVMSKQNIDIISRYLGVEPVLINSCHFSQQNRKRLYWANFYIEPAVGPGPFFSDVFGENCHPAAVRGRYIGVGAKTAQRLEVSDRNKANCLTTVSKDSVVSFRPPGRYWRPEKGEHYRYMSKEERSVMMGVRPDYCAPVSCAQAVKITGNGWEVRTIQHVLKNALRSA